MQGLGKENSERDNQGEQTTREIVIERQREREGHRTIGRDKTSTYERTKERMRLVCWSSLFLLSSLAFSLPLFCYLSLSVCRSLVFILSESLCLSPYYVLPPRFSSLSFPPLPPPLSFFLVSSFSSGLFFSSAVLSSSGKSKNNGTVWAHDSNRNLTVNLVYSHGSIQAT